MLKRIIFGIALLIAALTLFPLISVQSQTVFENPVFLPMVGGRAGSVTPPTPPPTPDGMILVDHNSVALFDRIPDQYIGAAKNTSMLFRHASQGANIRDALFNCMWVADPPVGQCGSANLWPRDSKYQVNENTWVFEFHDPPPNQNPGWWNKVYYFEDRMIGSGRNFQVAGFKFGYVDATPGSLIDDQFFNNNPSSNYPNIQDLEALEAANPNIDFMYWTMGVARAVGTQELVNFNQNLRTYAAQHGKILMDIADILSHDENGRPCMYGGNEAMCADYTDELNGGHLNEYGKVRMAKAFWVLMAQIAGWQP